MIEFFVVLFVDAREFDGPARDKAAESTGIGSAGVACSNDDVGDFPGFKRADLVSYADDFGGAQGDAADRGVFGEAVGDGHARVERQHLADAVKASTLG